ncbi:hypothetical protein WDW89_04780 [Deltaproteobacteria bacterium TL4]
MQSHQKPTLEEVLRQFEAWRLHKRHSREKIPEVLWQKASSLISHYPVSVIAKTLSLNHSVFKRRLQKKEVVAMERKSADEFVEANLDFPSLFSLSACQQVEFERSDGSRMRLVSSDHQGFDIYSLMTTFLEGHNASGHSAK